MREYMQQQEEVKQGCCAAPVSSSASSSNRSKCSRARSAAALFQGQQATRGTRQPTAGGEPRAETKSIFSGGLEAAQGTWPRSWPREVAPGRASAFP